MKLKHTCLAIISIFCIFLCGCSSDQLYATGQAYQRNQCQQMPDKYGRDSCMSKTDTSYDDYKRETDSSNK